ncbi:complement C1q tumor necrosis factor-related protein 3-like [Saccostrea cucullata]|uniref:complement C1q tumor necrosis factor-related protein 3-like n=1 Tax=Saccostrea cuccullata TaxID=36930 RepID=UPI002ED656DB
MKLLSITFAICAGVVSSQSQPQGHIDCCEANADTLQNIIQRVTSLEKELVSLKAENANLKQNSTAFTALQHELVALKSKQQPVAFFAELSQDLVNPSQGQKVVFDQILTNVGNAYDPTTGIFTVPVTGTYHLNVVLSSPNNNEAGHYMHFFILQNGRKIAYLFLDHNTDFWLHASTSTVIQGTKGDVIWLTVGVAGGKHILAGHRSGEGEIHSHMSGFLIQAD